MSNRLKLAVVAALVAIGFSIAVPHGSAQTTSGVSDKASGLNRVFEARLSEFSSSLLAADLMSMEVGDAHTDLNQTAAFVVDESAKLLINGEERPLADLANVPEGSLTRIWTRKTEPQQEVYRVHVWQDDEVCEEEEESSSSDEPDRRRAIAAISTASAGGGGGGGGGGGERIMNPIIPPPGGAPPEIAPPADPQPAVLLADAGMGVSDTANGSSSNQQPLVSAGGGVSNSANRRNAGRLVAVAAGVDNSANDAGGAENPLVSANAGVIDSTNQQATGTLADVNAGVVNSGNTSTSNANPLVGANAGVVNSGNHRATGRLVNANLGVTESGNSQNNGVNPLINANTGLHNSGNNQPTGRLVNANVGLAESGNNQNSGVNPLINANTGLHNSGNNQPTGRLVNANVGLTESGNNQNSGADPLINANTGLHNSGNNQTTGRLVDVNLGGLNSGNSDEGNSDEGNPDEGDLGPLPGSGLVESLQGRVHEAFARPLLDGVLEGCFSPELPPNPLAEIAPAELLPAEGGDLEHIQGYWVYDKAAESFVWTTGTLRRAPQGAKWVAGKWIRSKGGYLRLPGFWKAVGEVKQKPDLAAGEVLVEQFRIRTEQGVVRLGGYVDHAVERRGMLFAPLRATKAMVKPQRVLNLARCETVELRNLLMHLFVDQGENCFCFGDYYGEAGKALGLVPWHKTKNAPATLLGQYQRLHNNLNVNFVKRLAGWNRFFESNPAIRPPATLQGARRLASSVTNNPALCTGLLSADVARQATQLLERVSADAALSVDAALSASVNRSNAQHPANAAQQAAGQLGSAANASSLTGQLQQLSTSQTLGNTLNGQLTSTPSQLGSLNNTLNGVGGALSGGGLGGVGGVGGGLGGATGGGLGGTVGGAVGGVGSGLGGALGNLPVVGN